MTDPNADTTPEKNANGETNVSPIKLDQLKRNNEDCKTSLEVVLSCARNPEAKLGKVVYIKEDANFAKNMRILEQLGYVRNSEKQCFELPTGQMKCPFNQTPPPRVQLKDSDKKYIAKLNWLESNGYTRNKEDDCFELDEKAITAFNQSEKQAQITLKRKESALKLINGTKTVTAVAFLIVGGIAGFLIDSL